MPHVNIWIRKENYDLWQSIIDKPNWLNFCLTGINGDYELRWVNKKTGEKGLLLSEIVRKPVATYKGAETFDTQITYPDKPNVIKAPTEAVKAVFPRAQVFCKNGHPIPEGRSKCLGKGCKYA